MSPGREPEQSELARRRHALAGARGMRRLDLILEAPSPDALVRSIPADELYFTIREIGLADAAPLVQMASPEQFRGLLDLALWKGGHFDFRQALPWIRAARVGALRSDAAARRWAAKLAALDAEVVHLLLRSSLRIHDLDEDPDPELESDRFLRTPDGKLLLEFLVEGVEYAAVRGLVDALFAEDPFMAARSISSLRWDLPSELEETALRWRTARLADLGYPSLGEALSWFARPAGKPPVHAGVPARAPGAFLEVLPAGSLLERAAAKLEEGAREHLELELVAAANAVMVADAVDPDDLDAVRRAVETSRAWIELGLEAAAGGDESRAAEAMSSTPAKTLFQQGFARALALAWRAQRLLRSGHAGTLSQPLLDPPLGEAVSALALKRPLYFPGIELDRAEWGSAAAAAFEPRPFRSPADLARAGAALDLSEGLAALGDGLALRRSPDQAFPQGSGPRLSALYLTALANERLGRPFRPDPIAASELPAAARALERLEDPRLAARGEAGALLASLARAHGEELARVREGEPRAAEHVSALLVR